MIIILSGIIAVLIAYYMVGIKETANKINKKTQEKYDVNKNIK
jgi:hypothetical protein